MLIITVILLGIILSIGNILKYDHLIILIVLLLCSIVYKFYLGITHSNNIFGLYLIKTIEILFYFIISSSLIFLINKFKKIIIDD